MAGKTAKRWECAACSFVYDEAKQGIPWDELPDDWEWTACTCKGQA